MTNQTLYKDTYHISTDKGKLDLTAIHEFLSTKAYWCMHIPLERVQAAIENSFCFGVYQDGKQIGFARIITDFSTIAYLGDVYIVEAHRGQGLSKWLMETIMNHSALQGLRRWILLTGDAQGLYQQFGWTPIANPMNWMERHDPNVYDKL